MEFLVDLGIVFLESINLSLKRFSLRGELVSDSLELLGEVGLFLGVLLLVLPQLGLQVLEFLGAYGLLLLEPRDLLDHIGFQLLVLGLQVLDSDLQLLLLLNSFFEFLVIVSLEFGFKVFYSLITLLIKLINLFFQILNLLSVEFVLLSLESNGLLVVDFVLKILVLNIGIFLPELLQLFIELGLLLEVLLFLALPLLLLLGEL